MKHQKLVVAALGAIALGSATLTLTLNSNAQGGPPPPGGGAAGPRNQGGLQPGGPGAAPGPGFPNPAQGGGQFRGAAGGFPGGGGGFGGGGTAIDSDNAFLYIVQGNMLFRVGKSDLKIVNSTPLMQAPVRGGEFPAPARGGGFPGGPPPPDSAK